MREKCGFSRTETGGALASQRFRSIPELQKAYGFRLDAKTAHNWRLQFPARGTLRGLGEATLLATDGLLCLVDFGDGIAFEGHLANWIGPKGKRETKTGTCGFGRKKNNAQATPEVARKPTKKQLKLQELAEI